MSMMIVIHSRILDTLRFVLLFWLFFFSRQKRCLYFIVDCPFNVAHESAKGMESSRDVCVYGLTMVQSATTRPSTPSQAIR